jgi:multidrug efflux pump subunit AcrA (membrane-fusion protein)
MSEVDRSASDPAAPRPLPRLRRAVQAALAIGLIAAGAGGMLRLKKLKKPPETRAVDPVVREVRVVALEPGAHSIVVTGHGTARYRYRIPLTAQVSGKVIRVSPLLIAGRRLPAGTVLVEIEREDYENMLARARAEENRLGAQRRLLDENLKFDRERLSIARRASDLARKEFERVRNLLEQDKVGSEAGVETAERLYLERQRDVIALENSVAVQPVRAAELEAALAGARAARARAELELARTRISAPFDARVESASVQVGQVVSANAMGGASALAVLTDLAVLEIPIALDNSELAWLPIASVSEQGEYAFDSGVEVDVRWIQDPERGAWRGRLSRLERFRTETRTLVLVAEVVNNRAVVPGNGGLQLEEGMFCRVEVTCRTAEGVYAVPRTLVRQDRTLPLLVDGKLELRPVNVQRFQGDLALIDAGPVPGSRLVVSPLANPVPGMELRAAPPPGAGSPSPRETGQGEGTRP